MVLMVAQRSHSLACSTSSSWEAFSGMHALMARRKGLSLLLQRRKPKLSRGFRRRLRG